MWFRNLQVYRMPASWPMTAAALDERLQGQAFQPATALEPASLGWVAPRPGDPALVARVGGQYLLALREERKLLPASVIQRVVRERADQIEEAEGFRPGRKRLRELKDEVRDELMPRAFSLTRDIRLWIDPRHGWLVIDTASANRAADAFALLVRAVERFPGRSLKARRSPASAMTQWLVEGDPPAGFTIDQDLELRDPGGKASLRCANDTLAPDDVLRQVQAGKQCTRLALTWSDRVSFVLTERLELRRVRALDVNREADATTDADAQARFDADAALMTGELSRLLADLVESLDGLQDEGAA